MAEVEEQVGGAVTAVGRADTSAARRTMLRRAAARLISVAPDEVEIAHAAGRPPRLLRPAVGRVHLSSASRGELAAVVAAVRPVGIDVERVDADGEIPWNVLHPAEVVGLRGLTSGERNRAFAHLWTVKEAYLKALGIGLGREPGSFRVEISGDVIVSVEDPAATERVVAAVTRWTRHEGAEYAVATVVLRAPTEPMSRPDLAAV